MHNHSLLATALLAALIFAPSTAPAADVCELNAVQFLAGTGADGIGGTGLSGPDGIGGTGASGADGIGGTGISGPDGIGGTGIYGTLTRFGSLCVNGLHILLQDETQYQRNGAPSQFAEIALGQVLWVKAQNTPKGLHAFEVEAYSAVVGRVSSVDNDRRRFVVEGQTIVFGPSLPGADNSTPQRAGNTMPSVGDFVDVSGLHNEHGDIVASRVAPLRAPTGAYAAPPLREIIDSAPELAVLSVEGYLGPKIRPNRFLVAGLPIEAPELGLLAPDTRVWFTGARTSRDVLVATQTAFRPATDSLRPDPAAPGLREPAPTPTVPNVVPKQPRAPKPKTRTRPAPAAGDTNAVIPENSSNRQEGLFEIDAGGESLIDDALIDELIGMDPATTRAIEITPLETSNGALDLETSILIKPAPTKPLGSLDSSPRHDSPLEIDLPSDRESSLDTRP